MSTSRCESIFQNTGKSKCALTMTQIGKFVIMPANARFTGETIEEFSEWLFDNIQSASKTKRFYPFPLIHTLEDNSEDPATQTTGYGQIIVTRDGAISINGLSMPDFCQGKKMRSFNKQNVRVLLIDKGQVFGVQTSSGFTGYSVTPYITQAKLPTGDALTSIKTQLTFLDPTEYQDYTTAISINFSASEIEGLNDVKLVGKPGNNSFDVKMYSSCDNEDVTEDYKGALAVAGAWTVDGEVSTVAPTYEGGYFKFSSLTGGGVLDLANPEVLSELTIPVLGIESTGGITVMI